MKEELYHINTKDNLSIALWKLTSENISGKHIFLTHGAFSNKKICHGIAEHFSQEGFTCWTMEWRNHGDSSRSKKDFNLETIAKFDINSVFEFLFNVQKIENIDCIAHSGGGIALTMFLINHENYCSKINSITLFGVQAFSAGTALNNRMIILAGKYFSSVLGYVPAKIAGSTEHRERYYTMKQWFDWNIQSNFVGENGYDYLSKMDSVKVPILSICAKGDNFVAPRFACRRFLNAFNNDANKLLYLSVKSGNLEDYDHSRILKSQNSRKEVWPIVSEWISEKETMAHPQSVAC